MISGGLLFQKSNLSSFFLGIFVLVFTLKQASFLYETSDVLQWYPNLFMVTFPLSFLFGPLLLFHVRSLNAEYKWSGMKLLPHLIPFFILVLVTFYLFSMDGENRIAFIKAHLHSFVIPINYVKVTHILTYALLIIFGLKASFSNWSNKRKNYIIAVLLIYTISAFLQACFYASILRFKYFIVYHVIASTLLLIIAYILYFHPDILQKIKVKYAKSTLDEKDMIRIQHKIEAYLSTKDNFTKANVTLALLAAEIDEKKHHISQTLSQKFKLSFNDLINEKRVEYSKQLLVDKSYDKYKMLAIALDSGFTNKNTFNRAFLKFARCTPSEFKKTRNK